MFAIVELTGETDQGTKAGGADNVLIKYNDVLLLEYAGDGKLSRALTVSRIKIKTPVT